MEAFSITQPFDFMKVVFQISGIWTGQKGWPFLYKVYAVLVQTFLFFAFGISMCINLASIKNIEDITESFYMTLTIILMLIKILNLVVRSGNLLQFLEGVNSPLIEPETDGELEMFKRAYSSFNRQRNFLLVCGWSCILSALYASAFGDGDKLPYPGWFPFDWKHNQKYFWIAYSYQVFAMGLSCTTNVSTDLTGGYLSFQVSIFFRLVSRRLAAIGNSRGDGELFPDEKTIHALVRCIEMHQLVTR